MTVDLYIIRKLGLMLKNFPQVGAVLVCSFFTNMLPAMCPVSEVNLAVQA